MSLQFMLNKVCLLISVLMMMVTSSFADKVRFPDVSEFTWDVGYRSGIRQWRAKVTKDNVIWEGEFEGCGVSEDPRKLVFHLHDCKVKTWDDPIEGKPIFILTNLYTVYDEQRGKDDFWGRRISMTACLEGYTQYVKNKDASYEFTSEGGQEPTGENK